MIKKILNGASYLTRQALSNPLSGKLSYSFGELFLRRLGEGGNNNIGILIISGVAFDEELQQGFDFQQLRSSRGGAIRHKNSLYAA